MRDTKAIEEGNGRRKVGFLVNAEARMSEAREGGAMVPVDCWNGHEGALWKVGLRGHTVPGGRGGP